MKIAIIGKGNVGKSIGSGLTRSGHEVKFGHLDPKEPVDKVAKWGEIIVLVVPHDATDKAIKTIDKFADEKILIDVTNAIGPEMTYAAGCPNSASEEIQKMLPKTKVVKAFNTVFAKNQSSGKVGNQQLTAFIAGDAAEAKKTFMQLTREMGFDPVDCGSLKSARNLESMAILIINLAYELGMGTDMGFRLVKA